jgi:Flp pilus assembly protein TadD
MTQDKAPQNTILNIRREVLFCFFLVIATLAVYWQISTHRFVVYDDPTYVAENPYVLKGISWEGLEWAFSFKSKDKTHWHPLTWVSHMLDIQLYGPAAGSHLMINLIIHLLNSMFLFLVFRKMSNRFWESAFIAALFALHPLSVESVAWVAARKNVLSTFFWILTMLSYIRYAQQPNLARYGLVFFVFGLGLMAKPMLVTLPFVLLLLDYWPLARIQKGIFARYLPSVCWPAKNSDFAKAPLWRIVMEKIPLIVLSISSIFISSLALHQYGDLVPVHSVSMGLRISNAIVSYLAYIGKLLGPFHLTCFYPFPDTIPIWQVFLSLLFVTGVTVIAAMVIRTKPYIMVGWLWYLGTLAPVIGIVQAGLWPAIADRFVYVPSIGLFMIAAWGLSDLHRRWQPKRMWWVTGAALLILLLMSLTWRQAGYWRDSLTLFRHSVAVTRDNFLSHYALGYAYEQEGDKAKALQHYRESLQINPAQVDVLYNLAGIENATGSYDQAIHYYQRVLLLDPDDFETHNNLANAFFRQNRLDEAIDHYRSAIRIKPEYALAHRNLGAALIRNGQSKEAAHHLRETLRLNPRDHQAQQYLEIVRAKQNKADRTGAENSVNQPSSAIVTETAALKASDVDPLVHAFDLVGFKLSEKSRFLPFDDGYMIMGRVPLIDHMAEHPLFLQHWANETSDNIQLQAAQSLGSAMAAMFSTMSVEPDVYHKRNPGDLIRPSLADAYVYLCESYAVSPEPGAIQAIHDADFSDEFDRQLGKLVCALADATILARRSVRFLTDDEISYIGDHPQRFFFPDKTHFNFLTAPTHVQQKIVAIARKIDFASLFLSALMTSTAIDRFSEYIGDLKDRSNASIFFRSTSAPPPVCLHISTPIGDIVILGDVRNVFPGDGALVIDLGGNDRFTGTLAVGHRVPGRISVFIDVDGNDVYDRQETAFAQGFGCLSLGMMIDLDGNDRYLGGDMAQGSGMFGIGLLADFKGNDFYQMGLMGQGFGVFGFGLLLDNTGSDQYSIGGMGQGAGSTMGFGCLSDLKGNDKYIAGQALPDANLTPDTWTHAQGSGFSIRSPDWRNHVSFYGGIGFLSDGSGDDVYVASNGNSIASSYFMSIGCLVDHQGDDTYAPLKGNGMASAVHLANAVLIDRQGADRYFANRHSGGFSSDRSRAILADYEGNDIYGPSEDMLPGDVNKDFAQNDEKGPATVSQNQVQHQLAHLAYGAAYPPNSFALLIDYRGDDQYFVQENGREESCGGITPPVAPRQWSHAALLDLNGKDFYSKKGRYDNHYFRSFAHAICYDTQYNGLEIIAKESNARNKSTSLQTENILKSFQDSIIYDELSRLAATDLYTRFNIIGAIVRHESKPISDLIDILAVSRDRALNHDLIEALNYFIVGNEVKPRHGRQFVLLLKARDPFVSRYAARILGWRKIKSAVPSMLMAMKKGDPCSKPEIIWALGQIGSPEAITQIIQAQRNGTALACRRAIIHALSTIAQEQASDDFENAAKIKNVLKEAIHHPDEIIRTDAAKGLRIFGADSNVILELQNRMKDSSVYVKRAAAKSLILNGVREGIPVLIETLRFPSIDTFEHYDHELAADLAYYCGIDFSADRRYAYRTWKTWWDQNESNIDLKQNLSIMEEIQQAFRLPNEVGGTEIFERLLSENPSNEVIKNRYSRFCFEWITYRLLTQKRITAETLRRCRRLQKIRTRLEPQSSQMFADLAGFHIRLKEFNDAISSMQQALQLDPDNAAYKKALQRYILLAEQTDKQG